MGNLKRFLPVLILLGVLVPVAGVSMACGENGHGHYYYYGAYDSGYPHYYYYGGRYYYYDRDRDDWYYYGNRRERYYDRGEHRQYFSPRGGEHHEAEHHYGGR